MKYLIIISLFISEMVFAQVSIGIKNPDASSVLEIYSKTKGLLLPRMNTLERNSIVSPALGLIIFNNETGALEVFTGPSTTTSWVGITGATGEKGLTGDQGPQWVPFQQFRQVPQIQLLEQML
jgi:hypothetical protein